MEMAICFSLRTAEKDEKVTRVQDAALEWHGQTKTEVYKHTTEDGEDYCVEEDTNSQCGIATDGELV